MAAGDVKHISCVPEDSLLIVVIQAAIERLYIVCAVKFGGYGQKSLWRLIVIIAVIILASVHAFIDVCPV